MTTIRPSSTAAAWASAGGIHEIPLVVAEPPTGRLWLCGKHVIAPDPQAVLDAVGATTVVCLTRAHELEERYPTYVPWLRDHPDTVIWLPIHDFSVAPRPQMVGMLNDVVGRLRSGNGVVIHCAAGIGRAGTTAIGVLQVLGMPLEEALLHVRAHRPMAGPEVGEQLDFLRSLT